MTAARGVTFVALVGERAFGRVAVMDTVMVVDGSVVSPDLSGVPAERLEADICELRAHLDAALCRWLLLVAEYDRREAWASWECLSCAHWLSWKCGLSLTTAYEHLRVAHALEQFPLIRDTFARGELSYSKVRAITRVAHPAIEADLVDVARSSTGGGLDRICRAYRRHGRLVAGDDAARVFEQRSVRWCYDDHGGIAFEAHLPAELGEIVIAMIEAATADVAAGESSAEDSVPADSSAEEPSDSTPRESRAARFADGLVHAARTYLAGGTQDGGTGPPAAEITVLIAADQLTAARDDQTGTCETTAGSGLAPDVARRLACEGTVAALITDTDGNPLHLGRRRRVVSPRLRHALEIRDRTCGFPGCHRQGSLDAHHLIHWADGGPTDPDNLVMVCGFHHRRIHEGGYTLHRHPDGRLTATAPNGRHLDNQPAPAPAIEPLEHLHHHLGLDIGPHTNESWWEGRGPDISVLIEYFDQRINWS